MGLDIREADGGAFLLETEGGRIHSSRLAALNDTVVASLLTDEYASLYTEEYIGVPCGHLIFSDETGLQAFGVVAMGIYYACAKSAVQSLSQLTRPTINKTTGDVEYIAGAPQRAIAELPSWGLYPQTEEVVLKLVFARYGNIPYTANPARDPDYFKPLNDYLRTSEALNTNTTTDPKTGNERTSYYAKPRPKRPWNDEYWIEALTRIAVMNRSTTETADAQQAVADAFNGRMAKDSAGQLIIEDEPDYDVLFANQIAYEGIDLQTRTCALHHLDLPWEPATFTQRNGRAVRQGNMLSQVDIYAYLTDGTVDFYRLGRLEGRRAWLETVLAPTPSSAPIGGTTEEEQKALILACTLPEDEPEVRQRLDEQIALLKERRFAAQLVKIQQAFRALDVGYRITAHAPIFMEPRVPLRVLESGRAKVDQAQGFKALLQTQKNALSNLRSKEAEDHFPGYVSMRETALVRIVRDGDFIQSFDGGASFVPPTRGTDLLETLCGQALYEYKVARSGDDRALWLGRVGRVAKRQWRDGGRSHVTIWTEMAGVPLRLGDTIYGWIRYEASKVSDQLENQIDVNVPIKVMPMLVPGDPKTPKVADALAVYAREVEVARAGVSALKEQQDGSYRVSLFGATFPIPSNQQHETTLAAAPPLWLELNRTELRTVQMLALWRIATGDVHFDRFPDPLSGDDNGLAASYERLEVEWTTDAQEVKSRLFLIETGHKSSQLLTGALWRVSNITTGASASWSDLGKVEENPEDHKINWEVNGRAVRDLTPHEIDGSVVLGLIFWQMLLMQRGSKVRVLPLEGAFDPTLATLIRTSVGKNNVQPPLPLLAKENPGRRVYDRVHVSNKGVAFFDIRGADKKPYLFTSIDDFFDKLRNAESEGIVIDPSWPFPIMLRLLLPGVPTDIADFVALARVTPGFLPGADDKWVGWGFRYMTGVHEKWTIPTLVLDSPRATAWAAWQRAEAKKRGAQQDDLWSRAESARAAGGPTKPRRNTVQAQAIARWFEEAKKKHRAPTRVIFGYLGDYYLPKDAQKSGGLIHLKVTKIEPTKDFPGDSTGFARQLTSLKVPGVEAELRNAKAGLATLIQSGGDELLQVDLDTVFDYIG